MNLDLKDKVFIVTGGASGIGEAVARSLATEGAIPVIVDRSENRTNSITTELEGNGAQCMGMPISLASADDAQTVIRVVEEKFGKIDGIINNAGINDGVGLENGSPDAFRKSIETNLTHYYDVVYYALPHLKTSVGSIVNISSKTALTGQGGTSGYAASKGGQLALTREWAAELAPYGIRVNAIVPAEVRTPMYENWLSTFEDPKAKLQKIVDKIPLGKRMTEPEEIANTVLFLLSDKSAHTTGQLLFVDGGYVHLDRALT